jgi:hypothetical protein
VLIFFIIRFHYIIYIKPFFENKNKVNAFWDEEQTPCRKGRT